VNPFLATVFSLCLASGGTPREAMARESCDLIEVNHFHDEQGRLVFDQVIFYDWRAAENRYAIRAWRLVKNPSQLPQRDWKLGGYASVWHDGGVLRRVSAPVLRETSTQYDPEALDREFIPKENRRELSIPLSFVKAPKTK
jgi:hypothetical protein